MSKTDLERYTAACDYPGVLDEDAVERHLRNYQQALGVKQDLVRLRSGWRLHDHPVLKHTIDRIVDRLAGPSGFFAPAALAALDARAAPDACAARDAPDARDALAARDASDARAAWNALDADIPQAALPDLQRFASKYIQFASFWYGWDTAFLATTYLGAKQLKNDDVTAWSGPLFEAFVAGCWCLLWTDDTLYWFAKPAVHRDPTPGPPRLHNDRHAALESDIENLYLWHGVRVPAFVVVQPDQITLKHIDDERNAAVRRVLIERYRHGEEVAGTAAYIRDAGGRRLDHDERYGTLWHLAVQGGEPIVMIEVINSTREPDGHFKKYWLRVPPQMRTAHEAVAWTFGRSTKDYAPEIET